MRSAAVVCLLCVLHTAQAFTARPLQATMVSRRRQHHCAGPPVPVMSMLNQPGSSADAHDDAHGEDADVAGADADAELSPAIAPRGASDAGEGADGGDAEPQARHWRLERARLDRQHSLEVLRRKPRHLPYTGACRRCEESRSSRCGV